MKSIKSQIELVLDEIKSVLIENEIENISEVIHEIFTAKKIVTCGAGRVGYAIRGFCMRLGHLGFNSYHMGDTTVPRLGSQDLFVVASGSGETQTIVDLTRIAKKNGAKVVCFTNKPKSTIAELSDVIVEIKAQSKIDQSSSSVQPMTTLNEQCLSILFDATVLKIMEIKKIDSSEMHNRHSNLE